MITIYNTLTKKKEPFETIKPGVVHFYICGPTVYDLFHIGNARSFIMSDIVRRYLEYRGYTVKFVMNVTDIDDKIIKKSIAENRTAKAVAEQYSQAFFDDIAKLGIKPASVYPKATEHMEDILSLIGTLVVNGTAYVVDGNVFYNISSFPGYGKLSGKKLDELEAGSRVEINEEKKSPLDFALWKKAKEGEPTWESPWGLGRPGWHIECSAMSSKHLGTTFDIHAGGHDLIFPHHENEIAQSEAASGKPFVRYWIHFGFLNINEEKMSKSLGNFFTARDIVKQYDAKVIRFFFAQTHYSAPLNFTTDALDASKKGLEKFENMVNRIRSSQASGSAAAAVEGGFPIQKYETDFIEAVDDDFNTPKGLAVLFDFLRETNKYITEHPGEEAAVLAAAGIFLKKTAQEVLGIISFEEEAKTERGLEKDLIQLLIDIRLEAKKSKNFQLSDRIRDELKNLGILLEDSKEGTTYRT